MPAPTDIRRVRSEDPQWYRKIWTLDVQDMSWVEETKSQVDFLWEILGLNGKERVLDLACGFGRHAIELARRGCRVVGIDITADYVAAAQKQAGVQGVDAQFIRSDIRDVHFREEFDVVLNLADGAIGYLEDDEENLKIFDVISSSLKPGGKHVMDVCNGGYAAKHFPSRGWAFGNQSLSLADFEWDNRRSVMYYGGLGFRYGEIVKKQEVVYSNPTRLYTLRELSDIFEKRGMRMQKAFGDFSASVTATDDVFQMEVYSRKAAPAGA